MRNTSILIVCITALAVLFSGGVQAQTEPVVVTVTITGDALPGNTLTATADIEVLDGSQINSISWTQSSGVPVTIEGADTATATFTLPAEAAFKDELFKVLAEPPISEAQLPPNVELPEGGFVGGIQSRFQAVSVDPFSLEEGGQVTLMATVTTTSGTYTGEGQAHTELPWKVQTGLRNVPLGIPVLLHGRDHVDEDGDGLNDITGLPTTYDWSLLAPSVASTATLVDATSQNPYFIPDTQGKYLVTVTDTTRAPGNETVTLEIFAGTWEGVITGQDADGRPLAANCTRCHAPGSSIDKFSPWAQSGHAEIFTDNLNTNTHYGESCFPCHTVGFDRGVVNGAFDDVGDYQGFLDSGLINNPGDNWTTMLGLFPENAHLANIQCENCHGPQKSGGHGDFDSGLTGKDVRVDVSAGVCGTCHGEPLRHARYQQWQLSGHSNYELAIDEGESGSCSRCHTANGFLTWLPILLDNDPATDPVEDITVSWTADETHPQTCATCHDPHNPGSTTGVGTNATVRISGNTPPLIAGFQAFGVGRGAMCMTCHNSRRGLRNDGAPFDDPTRAPHGSAQSDVLMGENAYFMGVNQFGYVFRPGSHGRMNDTCVACHMEFTPPPDLLSYNLGGTNHTFFPDREVCSSCHVFPDAQIVQGPVQGKLSSLQDVIEEALLELMTQQIAAGNSIVLPDGVTITDAADIQEVVFGEASGRQALAFTFADGTTTDPIRVSDIQVGTGGLYDLADELIIKAGWNWNLINNDSSRGVHNPKYANDVLDTSIMAVAFAGL